MIERRIDWYIDWSRKRQCWTLKRISPPNFGMRMRRYLWKYPHAQRNTVLHKRNPKMRWYIDARLPWPFFSKPFRRQFWQRAFGEKINWDPNRKRDYTITSWHHENTFIGRLVEHTPTFKEILLFSIIVTVSVIISIYVIIFSIYLRLFISLYSIYHIKSVLTNGKCSSLRFISKRISFIYFSYFINILLYLLTLIDRYRGKKKGRKRERKEERKEKRSSK